MKLGYFGDGIWAHNAFDKIISDPRFSIQFVCVRNDSTDAVLAQKAKERGIDVLKHANINSEEFIETVKKYDCNIFVSMSFNQIFKEEMIELPPLKTINCHAGKLPFYRGRNILNWALINDEKEFGITVHYIDPGIDTGDIILQRSYPISDEDNYGSLLKIAHTECASILHEALVNIKEKKVQRISQESIDAKGSYCRMRKVGDEIVDWNQTSRQLFNFVRAISHPGPNARTTSNGEEIQIEKAIELAEVETEGVPGEVLEAEGKSLVVKTLDSAIKILSYRSESEIAVGTILK